MTVKDLLAQIASCPPEATVNVAVTDGLEVKMYPATNLQILLHNAEGREIRNLMIVTNVSKQGGMQ